MKLTSICIAVSLAIGSTTAFAGCYSEGVRTGVIQKFSDKGLINKSWEGEMVQDGIRTQNQKNGSGVTNIWKFSVIDPAVAKKIIDATFDAGGQPIRAAVKYCQSAFNTGLFQNTSYTVIDVKVSSSQ